MAMAPTPFGVAYLLLSLGLQAYMLKGTKESLSNWHKELGEARSISNKNKNLQMLLKNNNFDQVDFDLQLATEFSADGSIPTNIFDNLCEFINERFGNKTLFLNDLIEKLSLEYGIPYCISECVAKHIAALCQDWIQRQEEQPSNLTVMQKRIEMGILLAQSEDLYNFLNVNDHGIPYYLKRSRSSTTPNRQLSFSEATSLASRAKHFANLLIKTCETQIQPCAGFLNNLCTTFLAVKVVYPENSSEIFSERVGLSHFVVVELEKLWTKLIAENGTQDITMRLFEALSARMDETDFVTSLENVVSDVERQILMFQFDVIGKFCSYFSNECANNISRVAILQSTWAFPFLQETPKFPSLDSIN